MNNNEKIRVLLLEAKESDSHLLVDLLSTDCPGRFVITEIDHLDKALDALAEKEFDVILADITLLGSNGTDTVRSIQKVEPGLPVLVLCDIGSEALAEQIVSSCAQDYVVKGQGGGFLISKAIGYAIERKQSEQGLCRLAQYDSLTNLPNRVLFKERLNRTMIRADRNDQLAALMCIDLDRFKNINDTFGHDAGDILLLEVSRRIKECIREGDTVARWGGDEYAVILEDIKQVNDAAVVAKKILTHMEEVFVLEGQDVHITTSIGIAIYPIDNAGENDLNRNAEVAMYRAKEYGRNGFQFYTAGMNKKISERLKLETELRKALVNDEFLLFYQPKIDICSREIVGAEALIRWNHKQHGLVSPLDFIPLAEETGLIIPIGEWAIRAACKQVAEWEERGFSNICMAVNMSARQFNETDVPKLILESAIHANIEASKIDVEITESMLMDDIDASISIFNKLAAHGINISLDDFGTGYSSLSYLKKFNIDTLKIDKSFVRDITINADDAAIVSAIIALGKSLRLNVIAEGVETEEQLLFLKAKGCHQAQGFLFSKPLPAKDFTCLLERGNIYPRAESAVKFA